MNIFCQKEQNLEFLNSVTNMSNKFKIKIRNSKLFEQLQKNENFVKLLE